MLKGFRYERYNQQTGPIHLEFVSSHAVFRAKKLLLDDLPTKLLVTAAGLPIIGNPGLKKAAD
jgi:hypothetical protein